MKFNQPVKKGGRYSTLTDLINYSFNYIVFLLCLEKYTSKRRHFEQKNFNSETEK